MGEVVVMRRGEIWWGERPDEKGRPYLILTRDEAIPVVTRVLVAPVTRTVRSIASEIALGPDAGLPVDCVASVDNATTFRKAYLTRYVGAVPVERMHEVCSAVRAATGC